MEKEQVAKNLEEIAIIIKAYKPDAISMDKLTEYMQALGYAQVFVQSQINLSHDKSTDMNLVNKPHEVLKKMDAEAKHCQYMVDTISSYPVRSMWIERANAYQECSEMLRNALVLEQKTELENVER